MKHYHSIFTLLAFSLAGCLSAVQQPHTTATAPIVAAVDRAEAANKTAQEANTKLAALSESIGGNTDALKRHLMDVSNLQERIDYKSQSIRAILDHRTRLQKQAP